MAAGTHRVIYLSIAAALVTIALKSAAYFLTGSVGLLSDAIESLVNLVAALTAAFSLWYASQPVDAGHTYGHEKIEFFSSGLEGTFIIVAALGIAYYALQRLVHPASLEALDKGTALALLATVINGAVGYLLIRTGRRLGSIVLEADGRHLLTDVWTSAGVVLGIFLVWVTGLHWLDPVIALVVAANIVWTGFDLVRRSFDGLMDHALPPAEQDAVRAAIAGVLQPGMDFHALRTRRAGSRRFTDFHLLVPGIFTVRRAHEITEQVEQAIRAVFPDMEVTVHIEPVEDQTAYQDSPLVPIEQAARETRDPALPVPADPRSGC